MTRYLVSLHTRTCRRWTMPMIWCLYVLLTIWQGVLCVGS